MPRKAAKKPRSGGVKKAPNGNGAGKDVIDMDQAIALLKTTRPTFYRWLRSGKIKGMKVGRQWRFYRSDVERFLKGEPPRIDLPADIGPFLSTLEERLKALGGKPVPPGEGRVTMRAIRNMIRLGRVMRASNLHLAPHYIEEESRKVAVLRYRVDGVLHAVAELDLRLLPAIVDEWKGMVSCDLHEKLKPQSGRASVEVPGAKNPMDVVTTFLPATLGESITAHLLDRDAALEMLSLDSLQFAPRDRRVFQRQLEAPAGMIIVTGPTGSGKTTTIYSALRHLSRPEIKTITIEDPVEVHLPWMLQVALREKEGITFRSALIAALRSDVDVVFVGEIRDADTAIFATQVALTGHLVLTVLHAPDAAGGLTRMAKVSGSAHQFGEAIKVIVAQRLIRTLCPDCRQKKAPAPNLLDQAPELARAGGLDWDALDWGFHEPVGCTACADTGFRGREMIAEVLEVTPEISAALRRGAAADEITTIAVGQGMTTLAADGLRRAAEGRTALSEVLRVLGPR